MIQTIHTIELQGIEGELVDVEIYVGRGKPGFTIIGLPDPAIKESMIRIRTAFKSVLIDFPYVKKIIVNLAPADLKKESTRYDMAIVVGILQELHEFKIDTSDTIIVGELNLEGSFRHVRGIISIVDAAKKLGFSKVFVPKEDAQEAALIQGVEVYGFKTLQELLRHCIGEETVEQEICIQLDKKTVYEHDMRNIQGQMHAKRALEVACAGMHTLLMSGPPGSGKTLLAKTIASILPPLTDGESIEVSKLYSVSNVFRDTSTLSKQRPFRSPHHSSSPTSLIGGGRMPKPGEISLAHRGVLFLDELPEFPRISLETLRQPLEDGMVTIARVESSITYPARFMLVGAYNPCPCGMATDPEKHCSCSPLMVTRYIKKLSGPLLDRFDIALDVPRIPVEQLQHMNTDGESSEEIQKRVCRAAHIQQERFKGDGIQFNSEMSHTLVQKYCALDESSSKLLSQGIHKYLLSARAYYRVLKVARTIADLEESENILQSHIAESLQYRIR